MGQPFQNVLSITSLLKDDIGKKCVCGGGVFHSQTNLGNAGLMLLVFFTEEVSQHVLCQCALGVLNRRL